MSHWSKKFSNLACISYYNNKTLKTSNECVYLIIKGFKANSLKHLLLIR